MEIFIKSSDVIIAHSIYSHHIYMVWDLSAASYDHSTLFECSSACCILCKCEASRPSESSCERRLHLLTRKSDYKCCRTWDGNHCESSDVLSSCFSD